MNTDEYTDFCCIQIQLEFEYTVFMCIQIHEYHSFSVFKFMNSATSEYSWIWFKIWLLEYSVPLYLWDHTPAGVALPQSPKSCLRCILNMQCILVASQTFISVNIPPSVGTAPLPRHREPLSVWRPGPSNWTNSTVRHRLLDLRCYAGT